MKINPNKGIHNSASNTPPISSIGLKTGNYQDIYTNQTYNPPDRGNFIFNGETNCINPEKGTLEIGRDKENDIFIDNSTISRKHAVLQINDNGQLQIKDISSTGTFINGIKAKKDTWVNVKAGDKIDISDNEILIPWQNPEILSEDGNSLYLQNNQTLSLGRSSKSAINLENYSAVSRNHASVAFQNGKISITDNGSKFGTYINGEKMESGVNSILKDGDTVSLGGDNGFSFIVGDFVPYDNSEHENMKIKKAISNLGELGKIVKIEDYYVPEIKEHLKDLTLLPQNISKRLVEKGLKEINIANKKVTELDSNQYLKGQTPETAKSTTWDDVAGVYNPNSKSVSLGNGMHLCESLVLHEIGHAIGDLLKYDNSKELEQAHIRLYPKLTPYYQQKAPGNIAGRKELFAESVGVLLKRRRDFAVKAYDKEWIDFLEKQLLA